MLNTHKYELAPITLQELKTSDLYLHSLILSITTDR